MSKPKRNDPCPCGSGKKYKKCCGASNVVELSPVLYDRELENLHEMLLEFAFVNYEEDMKNIYSEYPIPDIYFNEDLIDTYMGGLMPWIILHEPITHTNQTIYDEFHKKQQSKIKRTRTKKIFEDWADSSPAVYEILSITEGSTNRILLQNVITEETYEVPLQAKDDYEEGNILIAVLLPFTQYHQFLFETIEMDSIMKEKIIELTEEYIAQDGNLTEFYPDFLVEALTLLPPTEALEWNNPVHEMVATHFSNNMRKFDEVEEDMIQAGILTWYYYCQLENPVIKKPGPYAAAMEYILRNKWNGEKYITQNLLAKDYNTSSASISKIVREIEEVMDEEMEELFDDMDHEFDIIGEDEELSDHSKSMKNLMENIQKLMDEHDFKSEEEMNAFLDQLLSSGEIPSPSPDDPRYKAMEKLYEAQETTGAQKREKLIKEALKIHPNSPDAYLLLANDAKSSQEYHHLVHQAVVAGKKDLGKEFFKENKGYFWGLAETRPYMRAKADYGYVLYKLDLVEEAINEFEEMLELNPNDNQGIRDTLLLIYIEQEYFKKAQDLMQKYAEDDMAVFGFSRTLVSYLTKGMTNKTKTLLKAADKQNPYVKDYLQGKKQIPEHTPQLIGFGDEAEAIVYTQDHLHLWMGEDELLEELAKI